MRASPYPVLAVFAVLALASVALPNWAVYLATAILARGLVGLGLLILGPPGLWSFGQPVFYGVGSSAVGLTQKYTGLRDAFALLALGVAAAVLVAWVLG